MQKAPATTSGHKKISEEKGKKLLNLRRSHCCSEKTHIL